MARIFISYRRADTAGHAGWLNHILSQHFGQHDVFRDINTIEPGVDFVEAIQQEVSTCSLLIAMIGRHWLTVTDKAGQRRLDNPHDYLRLEIAAALQRNIRVIPVLVHDAAMPPAEELPADLAPLARRNAVELHDASFVTDALRLIPVIEKVLNTPALEQVVDTSQQQPADVQTGSTHQSVPLIPQRTLEPDALDGKIAEAVEQTCGDAEELHAKGDNAQALELYDLAIKFAPTCARAYVGRGNVHRTLGQFDRAFADYDHALELDPAYAPGYYNRGLAYEHNDEEQAAHADFQRAADLGDATAKAKLKSR